MARALHPDTLAALDGDNVEWAAFCRFDFDSGTFAFGSVFQDTLIDGVTYIAAGDLGNVAPLVESTDSQPQDFEVTIGGVDLSLVSLYLSEPYLGRPAYVYYAVIDVAQNIIGDPILVFSGGMQEIAIVDGSVPTISITSSNELSDWNRTRPARYTDAEHQAFIKRRIKDGSLPAGFEDRGFEFVPQMETREIIWPAKSWFE